MNITPEMEEIVQYLHDKSNYAIFAGFAAFLLTGVESSPDIDIFVSSRNDIKKITDDFVTKGWNLLCQNDFVTTVEKRGTTFDIIFSESARKVFFPCRMRVPFKDKHLFCISSEALLLTKMNQLTSLQRSDYKTKRDRTVIDILRQTIDGEKVIQLVVNLEDSFWTEGW
jgi:hypothetical protein